MTRCQFFRTIAAAAAGAVVVLAGMSVSSPRGYAQNGNSSANGDESRIQQGFAIAPVHLNLKEKNRALMGLGSYLVNGPGAGTQSANANVPKTKMQVVLLGTGTPAPDPDRSGPATAIVVNGAAYLVDFGAGVVRRAKAAVLEKGITALEHRNLLVAFVTHLHSDHTVGYPDLIFTPAPRRVPLEVYGPKGLKTMTEHVIAAWQADIDLRNSTEKPQNYSVNVHEIGPEVIYKDANVTVTAFPTKHAYPETYGYRFETAERSIVISGDTSPTQATIDACHGCDVLIHGAMTVEWPARASKMFGWDFQSYAAKYHTTTVQLAELAAKAKPRLLVIYHVGSDETDGLLKEIRPRYSGQVVVGRDLDVY